MSSAISHFDVKRPSNVDMGEAVWDKEGMALAGFVNYNIANNTMDSNGCGLPAAWRCGRLANRAAPIR
jgi:hypothetical protein